MAARSIHPSVPPVPPTTRDSPHSMSCTPSVSPGQDAKSRDCGRRPPSANPDGRRAANPGQCAENTPGTTSRKPAHKKHGTHRRPGSFQQPRRVSDEASAREFARRLHPTTQHAGAPLLLALSTSRKKAAGRNARRPGRCAGATDRIRTCNPRFTKPMRYRCATVASRMFIVTQARTAVESSGDDSRIAHLARPVG